MESVMRDEAIPDKRMLEESDKGYNHPAYDPPTKTYTVQWTWVWFEEVDYGT